MGVDIFFVISGYLITSIIVNDLNAGDFTITRFYERRIRRIFPALIMTMIFTMISAWSFLFREEFRHVGKHIYSGAWFFSNVTLLEESGFFDISSELKPLSHLWSLSLEEQFYLLWPLLLAFLFRKRVPLSGYFLSIILISFSLNVFFISTNSVSTFYMLHTRAWELIIGAYLAINLHRLNFNRHYFSLVGLFILVAGFFVLDRSSLFPGWGALIPVGGASLIIAGNEKSWVTSKFLSNKNIIFIGLISYPLYLWHWPLLSFLRIIESNKPPLLLESIAVIIAFLFATLTYKFLEIPLRRVSSRILVPSLLGLMFLISAVGLLIKNSKTLPLFSSSVYERVFSVPRFTTENCLKRNPEMSRSYCKMSGPNPTVAIIGDSHSLALYDGIANYYKNSGVNVIHFGKGACLPVMNVEVRMDGMKDFCFDVMDKSFNAILASRDIQKVILVSNWTIFLSHPSRHLVAKDNSDLKSNIAIFENYLGATFDRFKASGKQVVLFHSFPIMGQDPKACVKLRSVGFSPAPKCHINYKQVEKLQRGYRQLVTKVLRMHPEVKVFDPLPHLCHQNSCMVMNGEVLFYRDKRHIGVDGSVYLSQFYNF